MRVTSFGEVLWNDFPNGKVLGGASLNVAVRSQSLGIDATIIGRRDDDADGEELLRQVQGKNANTDYLQVCQEYVTSLMKVYLDKSGDASYETVYPCTWDEISNDNAAIKRVTESDAFIFSSLATRDETSRKSLDVLLEEAKSKVFDINLHRPHYGIDHLLKTMKQSGMVKFNDNELYGLAAAYGSPHHSIEQNINYLVKPIGVKILCVTLGSHDVVLYEDDEMYRHYDFRVKVVDTVGSNDSFLSGLTYKLLNNAPPQEAIIFAYALGALATSRHGAMADIFLEKVETFMNLA